MKFIVFGLGSMGKRRIRCLKALGYNDIIGFDPRKDRRDESERKYDIITYEDIEQLKYDGIDALFISTPPDKHIDYINISIENEIPAFVEASVLIDGLEEADKKAKEKKIFIGPSCTLQFHPIIQDITKIVKSGDYGLFTNFSYISGQYLPDWHPWEKVSDYYVSNKETGAAREIVPFELTWLVNLIGLPKKVRCVYGSTMNVGAPIDDTYALSMEFEQGIGNLLVDVVSRFAVRNLVINLERAQITWDWNDGFMKLFEVDKRRWITFFCPTSEVEAGYNPNIIENMYIEEVKAFLDKVSGQGNYPNSLSKDIKVLEILREAEKNNDF